MQYATGVKEMFLERMQCCVEAVYIGKQKLIVLVRKGDGNVNINIAFVCTRSYCSFVELSKNRAGLCGFHASRCLKQ